MKFNRSVYQSLAMIGQFCINILVPVLVCSFLGILLDKKLGTSCFVIILFFVGAAAGFRNIYHFSKRIFEKGSSESAYLHKGRCTGKADKGYGTADAGKEDTDHAGIDSKNE